MPIIHWNTRTANPVPKAKAPARMPRIKWQPPFHW
jgi:hypothetical protein